MLVFVAEAGPEEGGECGEEDERGVEEDVARLGDQAVFEGDEHGGEEGGCGAAVEGAEGEVGEGDRGDSEAGGDHAHCDVGSVFVDSERK